SFLDRFITDEQLLEKRQLDTELRRGGGKDVRRRLRRYYCHYQPRSYYNPHFERNMLADQRSPGGRSSDRFHRHERNPPPRWEQGNEGHWSRHGQPPPPPPSWHHPPPPPPRPYPYQPMPPPPPSSWYPGPYEPPPRGHPPSYRRSR